jgi:Na+/H+ antiporter NhaD/arsenite permease-like protein
MLITGLIVAIFVVGYLLIALEHPLKIDKTAPALMTGVLTWALFSLGINYFGYHVPFEEVFHHLGLVFNPADADHVNVERLLGHFITEIAYILFFLLGAMTIVELIDMHDGFHLITSRIRTSDKRKVLWIIAFLTFFLSAVLDNLTTSIVMVSLLRKLIKDRETRLYYAGMVVIAANAGGAWSPIGDITTTMLWIGGQISVGPTIKDIFLPSLVCMAVPAAILSMRLKGNFPTGDVETVYKTTPSERTLVLSLGIGALLFVPIFKTVTHLPPFMGMLFGLSVLWFATEYIHQKKDHSEKSKYSVLRALSRIDTPSVLFFLGILSAVAALESIGVLEALAEALDHSVGNYDAIVLIMGVLSAIIDNVPLVAAAMGMYSIDQFAMDSHFWQFVAYCAGTGGSMLIIGSAAGVAVMGIEKIDFIWYLKTFGILAAVGYLAGAGTFILFNQIL